MRTLSPCVLLSRIKRTHKPRARARAQNRKGIFRGGKKKMHTRETGKERGVARPSERAQQGRDAGDGHGVGKTHTQRSAHALKKAHG